VLVLATHAALTRVAGAAAGNWLQLACVLGYSVAPHALAAVILAALTPRLGRALHEDCSQLALDHL
jgi:hypothetical protein